jgi:transposase
LRMGMGRYELSDVQWCRIERLLPGRVETVGRTAADNRIFVNGQIDCSHIMPVIAA